MQNPTTVQLFNSLGPVNGKLNGNAARTFLLKSNLPTHSLRDIWDNSDRDKDGQLTLEEFTIAVQLVQQCRRGTNAAIANSVRTLPLQNRHPSTVSPGKQLAAGTIPSQRAQQQPTTPRSQQLAAANWSSFSGDADKSSPLKAGGNMSSVPASISKEIWVVDLNSKKRYLALFHRLDSKRAGSVPGVLVRQEFMKSGLPVTTLSNIWNLADITKTGSLSADEFCVAMYLIESAQRGTDPPPTLTPALVPPQYRHVLVKEMVMSSSGGTSPGGNKSIFTKPTFENKKLENFNKGEQELERRRLEVLEKERAEQENRDAEAAAALELERQRAELQARRALEFQRQRTRSMEEAARKRQEEEQVQQTVYRNKMETWAVQRKEQLEGQMVRLRDLTTGLRTRKLLLDKELADLEARCRASAGRLDSGRNEKRASLLQIEKLKNYKDEIIREVNSARMAVESSQSELATITNDKLRLSQQLRARRNPDEVMISILEEQEKAKQSIISLRTEQETTFGKVQGYKSEQEKFYIIQQDITERLAEKEDELQQKQRLLAGLEQRKQEQENRELEMKRQREEEKLHQNQLDEKLKCIEESLKACSSSKAKARAAAETERRQQDRKEIELYNELLSHRSEEADRNIQNAVKAAQLATEAVDSQRGRLKRLVELERQKTETETEQFYARASSIPRIPKKKTPRKVRKKAPSTDNLICLDTPPRPTEKVNYMRDLASVLSSPPSSPKPVVCPVLGSTAMSPDSPEVWGTPNAPASCTSPNEPEEQENSIYINMDMLGVLNKPPLPPKTGGGQFTPDLEFYDASSSVVEYQIADPPVGVEQEEEHIYALASTVVHPTGTVHPTSTEVLFEVEATEDYSGEQLSFSSGARIKVFEVRDDYYLGEYENKTGLFPVSVAEKCEWIYSDFGPQSIAEAMYDFTSDVEGDLSFVAGEVITITEELGEWYKGYIGHRTGIFPGNFVQIREEEEEEDMQPPPFSLLPDTDFTPVATAEVTEQYHTEDISLSVGDKVSVLTQPDPANVYIQNAEGQRAWVKTSLLKLKEELHLPLNAAPIGAERIPASLHCYSLFTYNAQNSDELTLKTNDIITITEQSDPSWWIGRLGNQVGVLPSNYVEQINDHTTWETVKSWNANLLAAEDERTRQEAIHELITTEKTYLDDLLLVIEVFYNPLCSVATEEELSKVFVNWQQLILCNARLFRALYNTSDINSFETVGAVISDEIESLVGAYTKFCSCQRDAMTTLKDLTSPMFKAKENECAQSPKVGKLPLSTFLLKPMQRITKYPLLIKKILSHTKENHPDFQCLRDALSKTEDLLMCVNEAVRATNRLESLQRVFVKCLNDDLGERVQLNSNTNCLGPRKLVHFGSLSKSKGGKEMFAALFNDVFWMAKVVDRGRYGSKPIDLDARDFDLLKFEQYREPFLLQNTCISENIKTTDNNISFTHNDKNYTFYCTSSKECEVWTEYLTDTIRHATLLHHQSHHRNAIPDPTVSGQATVTIRIVEALELALPVDEKPTGIFTQACLSGHTQRTPTAAPKWDHSMYFVLQDISSDKITITVYKERTYSPNLPLGKFDLSLAKLTKSGGSGPWNKRLILTDASSGAVNVSISIRYHGNR